MTKFPNYRTVTLDAGKDAKLSPLRIGDKDAQKTLAIVGDFMDGKIGSLMRGAETVYASIRTSVRENHSESETANLVDNIRFSTSPDSVFIACLLALVGLDAPEPVDADENQ